MSDITISAPEDTTTEADAPVEEPTVEETVAPATTGRAPRTDLEGDLRIVLDNFVTGDLVLPDGKSLTPHAIANAIHAQRGLDTVKPSSGAVSAALARWVEIGFITVNEKPLSFADYTDAGRTEGLGALKSAHRARLASARAATKAAAAPAVDPAPAPAVDADVTPGEPF
jgi:hypothetical protein